MKQHKQKIFPQKVKHNVHAKFATLEIMCSFASIPFFYIHSTRKQNLSFDFNLTYKGKKKCWELKHNWYLKAIFALMNTLKQQQLLLFQHDGD